MRAGHRLSLAMVLATLFAIIGTTMPASAKNCAGQGNMRLSRKVGLPIVGGAQNVSYTINIKCTVGGGTRTATGFLTAASCLGWKGTGTVSGQSFKVNSAGSVLILTGEVTGVLSTLADARKGDNCSNTTADDFLVTAAVNGL